MSECRWCGDTHAKGICPKVKAIEFMGDGETVRRVEFLTPADYHPWPAMVTAIPTHHLPGPSPTPGTPKWPSSITSQPPEYALRPHTIGIGP